MLRIKSIRPKYIPWRLLNSSDCLQLSIQSLKCACSKCRKKVAGRMWRQKANYEHKTTISLSSKCKRENSKANGFQRGCWSTLTSVGDFFFLELNSGREKLGHLSISQRSEAAFNAQIKIMFTWSMVESMYSKRSNSAIHKCFDD